MTYKIYLYDTDTDCIGSGTLSSTYVQSQLEAAAGQDVEVHISSVGGSAFDAIAIYDLLKKYNGNVITYIDALAASAASIVAMGGQQVVMSKYALLMIHKPMVGTGGNADELLKDVQMLNIVQARLAQIYMDKTGLDGVTINSLINAVTWLSADQALDLGFIDQVEDYSADITNSALIKNYVNTAPVFYQRYINKILTKKSNMNIENKELIEKTTSVLDKIMNFFKKVVNKQTITDKGTLHHAGELDEGTEVYNDEDMSSPAASDCYTTASGSKIAVQGGQVQKITPPTADPDAVPDADDDDDSAPSDKFKAAKKPVDVQNKLQSIKAKLHAQNALLNEAKDALEAANLRLKKTREEVKNEIRSDFSPEGSKRSNKAKTEPVPFFAPQTALAQNAVRKAVAK
ncbi:head maturation protease, ClpP-related [Mucilaginibacter gotjawali]|uniref:ATP-dependent Clp protease proteolytic subunit n=2 Tax=Mucilaginibacter gotjawali TaxID=1550579 RepID=A0A110B1K6_9SPHI|nr:head maturation protease, ClpP-related [Mucilaginibacter gotjawali]MBB3057259.1 ATP-dependent protease ClpP protease subunit [Mucilaginibacter gotjawali]BAU52973.1 ATP-dependent Clp protease proteolytic subunit 2 [Mucilaginibacter gotjawali]